MAAILIVVAGSAWSDDSLPVRRVSREAIESLRVLATSSLLDGRQIQDVILPDCFLGDVIVGKIELRNETGDPVTIDRLTTSCGCTAGVIENSDIEAEESGSVIVDVQPKKLGPFEAELRVHSEFGWHRYRLRSRAKSRVSLERSRFEVSDPESRMIQLKLLVADPAIDPDRVRLVIPGIGEATALGGGAYRVVLPESVESPWLSVLAELGDKTIGKMTILVEPEGGLRIHRKRIFFHVTERSASAAVIFSGSRAKQVQVGDVVLTQGAKRLPIAVELKRTDSLLICQIRMDESAVVSGEAVLSVGDRNFDISITQR